MNIQVSILIPCYNSAPFVAETLDSVLAQTYANWECIVVDDHSTDNSVEIINTYCQKYPEKFKLYTNPRKGACAARNYGISKASGELFQFLDSDDILDKDKLERQIQYYRQFGYKYIYSAEMGTVSGIDRKKDEGYELYERNFTPVEYFDTVMNQFGKYLTTGIWLIPKYLISSINGWDEKLKSNQDGEYFMRLICKSKGICFVPNSLFYYRRNVPNSISKQRSKKQYESRLCSYKSYTNHFLENFELSKAKELAWKGLSKFYCGTYPHYPDLLKECKNEMNKLGYNNPNAYGGTVFCKTSKIIGTLPTLKLWHLRSKIKNTFRKNKIISNNRELN